MQSAARAMGLQIEIFRASTSREIDAAFAPFVSERPDALFVAGDAFFTSRRVQLANLAARHMIPMRTSTLASKRERIERCHRAGLIFQRQMADSGRSASLHWKIRSSRRRWLRS